MLNPAIDKIIFILKLIMAIAIKKKISNFIYINNMILTLIKGGY